MNLLLTGKIQVGKTTLIKRLIKDLDISVAGFYTSRHFVRDKQDGFIIKDLSGSLTSDETTFYIAKGSPGTGWQPCPETFETIGVQILQNCLKSNSDLILMDELGHFESQAPLFQKLVHQCLSSPIPVLGVIKPRRTPFLDSIRQRTDVQVVTITPENRDDHYLILSKQFQRFFRG